MAPQKSDKIRIIRAIYLYLVTAISIVILIISAIGLVRLVLEEYVFDVKPWNAFEKTYYECENPENVDMIIREENGEIAKPVVPPSTVDTDDVDSDFDKEQCILDAKLSREEQHKNDVKRSLIEYFSMIIVALPLYLYHWTIIKREAKK